MEGFSKYLKVSVQVEMAEELERQEADRKLQAEKLKNKMEVKRMKMNNQISTIEKRKKKIQFYFEIFNFAVVEYISYFLGRAIYSTPYNYKRYSS